MEKKICIIHFNTPDLTYCLVRSINKYTPGATIYIFDNSDKKPFLNTFDNVTVFDNTKGQIIDFNEVLKKYPLHVKSRGKTNNYGSAKHAISIQKCVELIGENFVLLDSDVLLKRDITPIFNDKYVWVAGTEYWTNKSIVGATKRKRVCPFITFMNVDKMKDLGIEFYNDTHMLGFNNGPKCEEYETGVWFYEITPKELRREINYSDYVVHFRAGSWLEDARTKHKYKQVDPAKWLERNKKYWLKEGEELSPNWYRQFAQLKTEKEEKTKTTMTAFKNIFDHIYCLHYLPSADRLPKIKEELKSVGIDENANYFSWVYDYPSPITDLVYADNRVNMDKALKASSRPYIKRVSMKHYEIVKQAYALGYKKILILEDDVRFHKDTNHITELLNNIPNTDIVMFDKMVCSATGEGIKYKKYVKTLPEDTLYGDINESGVFFIFCSCYALNRKGMEHIIKAHEAGLLPPDTPFNSKEITGSFAIENLAIQDPKLKTRRVETYDKIGLDTSKYFANDIKFSAPAKPAGKPEPPKKALEKPRVEAPGKVVFRTKPMPPSKRRLEPAPVPKAPPLKPIPKSDRPLVTQRAILVDKKKTSPQTRVIRGKSSGFNKLYDTWG